MLKRVRSQGLALLSFGAMVLLARPVYGLCEPSGPFTPDSMYRIIETRACCADTNEGQLHWWTIQMRNRSSKTVTVHWRVLTPAYGGDTNNCCETRLDPGETQDFTFRSTSASCGGRVTHQILSVKEND
jgi:hypothetical protein